MAEQIIADKIKGLVRGFNDEEREEALKHFSDRELLDELGVRLSARADSLSAVLDALGGTR